jgi:hypothetical protein
MTMEAVAMREIAAGRGSLIMRAISMALLALLGAVGASAAEAAENLVRNGDFEAGFKDGVAAGWKTWDDAWGVREYYDETANPHGGQHAQGWRNVKGSCSGVYQVVKGVTPGQAYRATMWTWYQTEGDMWVECGFDPAGGSDRSDVHWTRLSDVGKVGQWLRYEADLVAKGNAVSLWFKWGTLSESGGSGCADDVSLAPIDEALVNWCSVAGNVFVAGGPALPGAQVTMRPGPSQAAAAGDGGFAFRKLYPDKYSFTAEKHGYLPDSVSDLKIAGGESARVELTLHPEEHVVAGDFESTFTEGIACCWTPWQAEGSRFAASRATEIKHGGDACQEMHAITGRSGLRQVVAGLEEGATYALSVWVLGEQDAQVACGYDLAGGKELGDATWIAEAAPAGDGWRHYTVRLTPARDRLTIWLSWQGGRGWADDISLVRHDPDLDAVR